MLADEKLRKSLSHARVRIEHLFGSHPHLISNILIKSVSRLRKKSVNREGVQTMVRNIFALQQNITNMVSVPNIHFDRARTYWQFLNEHV